MKNQGRHGDFDQVMLPHLDAAYNHARWLTRDDSQAEDIVQEAFLRAFKFFAGFHGENGRAWLLAIVRNTYYTSLDKNRLETLSVPFDEDILAANGYDVNALMVDADYRVERVLEVEDNRRLVNQALRQLPAEYREVIILRELEEMSYKEIATITNIPIGTVMSRLARGRKFLLQHLQQSNLDSASAKRDIAVEASVRQRSFAR